MSESIERMMKKLEGDGPLEKQIILLKLTEALENSPEFGGEPAMDTDTPQRKWISEVGALLSRLGTGKKVRFSSSLGMLTQYWVHTTVAIKGQVLDAIEELKLELELDGRSEIGNAYAPGDVYRFYADLKAVIGTASNDILIVDPYFNGEAFDAYLCEVEAGLTIRILADKYSKGINTYAEKHMAQYGTQIEIRRSKQIHDRIVLVDDDASWIMGGSIKDAGKKATYLIPLATQISEAKREIYNAIWEQSEKVGSGT